MNILNFKNGALDSKFFLGIEFGSTRIKAIMIDESHRVIAKGIHEWENQLIDGVWTYALQDVIKGLQDCIHNVKIDYRNQYNSKLKHIDGIGISAMMHGYLVVDSDDKLLTSFRTWRNTFTKEASEILSNKFQFNIPQRWSIAHLYQAILHDEDHVSRIHLQTTLAGYIHYLLTGKNVIGVGDASGMFPVDRIKNDFNEKMINQFEELIDTYHFDWRIRDILPCILQAGDDAGVLSDAGAKLLDPDGDLKAGIPFCPPEGDAGTGMVATNSVKPKSGNVSVGTSIFAMIVLENNLKNIHNSIDIVSTPDGKPVAMVHCNNGTSELNAWISLFHELLIMTNVEISKDNLYSKLFSKAIEDQLMDGALIACNYLSGEHITGFEEGYPIFVRNPQGTFNLANFILTQIYSSLATLRIGMDILTKEEGIIVDSLFGHGGFFRTTEVGQKIMAASLNTPVSVMENASEGGAWGCAVLVAYKANRKTKQGLNDYLNTEVFNQSKLCNMQVDENLKESFDSYMVEYVKCLNIERFTIQTIGKGKNVG